MQKAASQIVGMSVAPGAAVTGGNVYAVVDIVAMLVVVTAVVLVRAVVAAAVVVAPEDVVDTVDVVVVLPPAVVLVVGAAVVVVATVVVEVDVAVVVGVAATVVVDAVVVATLAAVVDAVVAAVVVVDATAATVEVEGVDGLLVVAGGGLGVATSPHSSPTKPASQMHFGFFHGFLRLSSSQSPLLPQSSFQHMARRHVPLPRHLGWRSASSNPRNSHSELLHAEHLLSAVATAAHHTATMRRQMRTQQVMMIKTGS